MRLGDDGRARPVSSIQQEAVAPVYSQRPTWMSTRQDVEELDAHE
jgi:hypothetical protein